MQAGTMTPDKRLEKIIDDGLCIGCGLCTAIASEDAPPFGRDGEGEPRPFAGPALDDAVMDLVYDICPGFNLEGLPQELASAAPQQDLVWGPHVRMLQAHAGDPQQRHEAATGGALTALACQLLESGEVGMIAHVRAADKPPHFGEATVSRTTEEVLAAAGSRYGPTAALARIGSLLDGNEPFALIAKPCDLNAMRRLAHHDPRVDRLVRYWLTPVCGGYMPDVGFRRFASRMGHDPDSITAVRYRGHGCPGPTRIEQSDGSAAEHHYLDVWGDDDSQWVLSFRCKVCADARGGENRPRKQCRNCPHASRRAACRGGNQIGTACRGDGTGHRRSGPYATAPCPQEVERACTLPRPCRRRQSRASPFQYAGGAAGCCSRRG